MTPDEFRERWLSLRLEVDSDAADRDDQFIRPDEATLATLRISDGDKTFLRRAGLPRSAAPFLSFDELGKGCPRVYETWGTPEGWTDDDRRRLRAFRCIGSDGSGNPVCINEDDGAVLLLDHDTWFEDVMFVNTGIAQLAQCLLAYRALVAETLLLGGPDVYLQGTISDESRAATKAVMLSVDRAAMAENALWASELSAA